ncbi:MAG TPA: DMT family transporter [Acidimicrobiia bacterium]|nr:DMT family transporter [Acidimicrobiia bacterium]
MTQRLARLGGPAIACITAVVSGFAIFLNGYGVRAWADAGVGATPYTTAKNLVAAVALVAIAIGATRRRRETGRLTNSHKARLFAVGIIGGAVPFVLFFEGLARASSVQAAFIHKTLVVWVALLAVPLLGERLSGLHLTAIGLLVGGEAVVAGIDSITVGTGELMILGATLLWAIEVVIAKTLLRDLSSSLVGATRMGVGAVALVGWTFLSGSFGGLTGLSASAWGWIAATGGALTAYVGTWYLALSKAQAVDVTAVLVLGALITAALRTGIAGAGLPSPVGLALLAVGGAAAIAAMLRPAPR